MPTEWNWIPLMTGCLRRDGLHQALVLVTALQIRQCTIDHQQKGVTGDHREHGGGLKPDPQERKRLIFQRLRASLKRFLGSFSHSFAQ